MIGVSGCWGSQAQPSIRSQPTRSSLPVAVGEMRCAAGPFDASDVGAGAHVRLCRPKQRRGSPCSRRCSVTARYPTSPRAGVSCHRYPGECFANCLGTRRRPGTAPRSRSQSEPRTPRRPAGSGPSPSVSARPSTTASNGMTSVQYRAPKQSPAHQHVKVEIKIACAPKVASSQGTSIPGRSRKNANGR